MALDVYGLTRHRDLATMARFLDEYVDRLVSADRGDEDIGLEPLVTLPEETEARWEWVPSQTLGHILVLGLAYPRRAFTVYLKCLPACHESRIERAILGFTRDDQLVLGLSISTGENMWEASGRQARRKHMSSLRTSLKHIGGISA
jgi:hypothetical protein